MAIRDELQNLMDAMVTVYTAGDAAGWAALFTPDATLLSPYAPPAHGRAAIKEVHRGWVGHGGGNKTITVVDAGVSGDLAWGLAHYSEGDATGDGTSLLIFARQPRGGRLCHLCSLNSMVPPLAQPRKTAPTPLALAPPPA